VRNQLQVKGDMGFRRQGQRQIQVVNVVLFRAS